MATIINKKKNPLTYRQLMDDYPHHWFKVEQRDGNLFLICIAKAIEFMSKDEIQKAKGLQVVSKTYVCFEKAPRVWVIVDNSIDEDQLDREQNILSIKRPSFSDLIKQKRS